MVTIAPFRKALAAGRTAVINHRLNGGPEPVCPYTKGTSRQRYWDWGVQRATKAVDELLDIGA